MGMLKLEVQHSFAKEEARQRVEALLRYWADRYGVRSSWNGDRATLTGKAVGVSIDGFVQVSDRSVGCEAADPGFLLRGQAQKYLTKKFGAFLDPSKGLSDLDGDEG